MVASSGESISGLRLPCQRRRCGQFHEHRRQQNIEQCFQKISGVLARGVRVDRYKPGSLDERGLEDLEYSRFVDDSGNSDGSDSDAHMTPAAAHIRSENCTVLPS